MRAIIIAALALAGCATSSLDQRMAARVGQSIDSVIAAAGPPTSERRVGERTFYLWSRRTEAGGFVWTCDASFEVDGAGVIVGHHYTGNADFCPAV